MFFNLEVDFVCIKCMCIKCMPLALDVYANKNKKKSYMIANKTTIHFRTNKLNVNNISLFHSYHQVQNYGAGGSKVFSFASIN